jgi:hypothetical protein
VVRCPFGTKTAFWSAVGVDRCGSKGFDQDSFGKLLAYGQAGITNLANEIGLAGEKPDDLVFAKSEFTEPILNLRRGA